MTRPTRAVAHVAAVAILLIVLALPLYSRDVLAAGTAQVRTIPVNAIVSQTAIYGHSIVWTQSVPPSHGNLVPESLYWSDLAQVIPHRIFTFPSGTTALNLRVSADWIAADLSGTRGSSIWVFNRHTHQSHVVAFRPISGVSTLQGFTLSNDSLAFVVLVPKKHERSGTFQVHVLNLPNGPERQVFSRQMSCGSLSLTSQTGSLFLGAISYQCTGSDVFQLDSQANTISPLTVNHHSMDAASNGLQATWLQYRPGAGGGEPSGIVVLTDLTTNRKIEISKAAAGWPARCRGGAGGTEDRCAQLPGITTSLAYWLNGLGDPAVYDLATGRSQVIQTSRPPGMGGFGQGFGSRLTWASQQSEPTPGRPRSWIVIAYVP